MSAAVPQKQQVPPDDDTRLRIREEARRIIADERLVPPFTLDRLHARTAGILDRLGLAHAPYLHYAIILFNTCLWETVFAAFPRDQRLLLLPRCLRNPDHCQAEQDELGLICRACGGCPIQAFSEKAEAQEIPVLISESSSSVSEWVEQGVIQAVIGVSCLESMEKTFPAMLRNGIPGLGIPLLTDGCRNTQPDTRFLEEALAIPEREPLPLPLFSELQARLDQLFQPLTLKRHLALEERAAEHFPFDALLHLLTQGRHYRPLLAAAIYRALSRQTAFPPFTDAVFLAIECFHKASLIHDDIEDQDDCRYGEPTLHRQIGLAAALNAGDFLLGEGYRLLLHPDLSAEQRSAMIAEACRAHCELTLGQSLEFESEGSRTLESCLEIARLKTVPAFRVALILGAIAAGERVAFQPLLEAFADAFGIAFQLRDDLDDEAPNPASAVDCVMHTQALSRDAARAVVIDRYNAYRSRAYAALEPLRDPALKILLFRLIGKVLKDV